MPPNISFKDNLSMEVPVEKDNVENPFYRKPFFRTLKKFKRVEDSKNFTFFKIGHLLLSTVIFQSASVFLRIFPVWTDYTMATGILSFLIMVVIHRFSFESSRWMVINNSEKFEDI